MTNPTRSAFLLIDMEYGFLSPDSIHFVKGAMETVPACRRAIQIARAKQIPLFFIKRHYRADGSDVESTRYESWVKGGRGMRPGSWGAGEPEGLSPQTGDYAIIKHRYSAFFQTELDLILRRLGVRTVILAGTTTPHCIRATCYDANSLDYNVVVLSDCTSSQTEEIQNANLFDMAQIGTLIWTVDDLERYKPGDVPDLAASILDDLTKGKHRT
jgi:nicotinamidase-related amidase